LHFSGEQISKNSGMLVCDQDAALMGWTSVKGLDPPWVPICSFSGYEDMCASADFPVSQHRLYDAVTTFP
jgi:hypothetical protein